MALHTRLTARDGGLIVVDVQQKLIDLIADGPLVVANSVRLIQGAKLLSIPVWATEQYPQGLGPTVDAVARLLPDRQTKTAFSCCAVPNLLEQLLARPLRHVTLAGIETHVCVAQTALDLMAGGLQVQVAADAVASRGKLDWELALRRLERAGAIISTTEAILFEWVETSDCGAFKEISALVKQGPA